MFRPFLSAACVTVCLLGGASMAAAQASDAATVVQAALGVSTGNKVRPAVSVEVNRALTERAVVFVEGAWVSSVSPAFISDRAETLAKAIGGTVDQRDRATSFALGAKYLLAPADSATQPYIGAGVGTMTIAKTSTFTVGSTAVTDALLGSAYGVSLGADLSGSTTKLSMLGVAGLARMVGDKAMLDVSYRYGVAIPRTSVISGDKAIHVHRFMAALGYRF